MKKTFLPILALALSATACVSDADLDVADNTGYINVNLSADDAMQTRTVQDVTDLTTWTIKVGETTWTNSTQAFKEGDYVVTASNYASLKDALKANDNWGDAFYQGSTNVTVTRGETADANIDCGTAQNARLEVVIATMPDVIKNVTVTVSSTADYRTTLTFPTAGKEFAYFGPKEVINYSIAYEYNNTEIPAINGTIEMKGAATTNTINVSANDNGTINVTVTYDDTFGIGNSETITIDAATGAVVSTTESGSQGA